MNRYSDAITKSFMSNMSCNVFFLFSLMGGMKYFMELMYT